MAFTILSFIFVAIFFNCSSPLLASVENASRCGISSFYGGTSGKLIINGQMMNNPTKLPWMAILLISNDHDFYCTASIIGRKHILTAAHCLEWGSANFFKVMVGTVDYKKANNSVLNIKSIFKFDEDYFKGDIAIIELEEELNFTATVQPICLTANDESVFNKMAIIAGWGINNYNAGHYEMDSQLRFGQMQVIQNQSICSNDSYGIFDEKKELCLSGYNTPSQSRICKGDSGGPLIVKLPGQKHWTQIGVTSRYNTEEKCGPLDIHTRVSYYCDWIRKVTNGAVKCK